MENTNSSLNSQPLPDAKKNAPAAEKSPDHILSREEVIEVLSRYAERGVITRELSNEDGIYLLEMTTEGPQVGETTEFTYRRMGTYPNKIQSPETLIEAAYYQDGFPISADTLATYNPQTGTWTHYPNEEIKKIYTVVRRALGKEVFEILLAKGHEHLLAAYKFIYKEGMQK
ncbi:MAG: hypothetical protein WC884_00145 [Candidatus Paceibacterota bacterium]